jgi:hypothetical protein
MFGSSVVVVARSLRAGRETDDPDVADVVMKREARHAWST